MVKIDPEIERVIKEAIAKLRERIPIDEAYLFGSYARGEADKSSDIDLAAFSPGLETMNINDKVNLIARIQMEIKAPLEIHIYDSTCLQKARPTNIYGHILETGLRMG